MNTTAKKFSDMTPEELDFHLSGGYGGERLTKTFRLVTHGMANWKMPISTTFGPNIDTPEFRAEVAAAIGFCAGGEATFVDLPGGGFVVEAPGYYALIGA